MGFSKGLQVTAISICDFVLTPAFCCISQVYKHTDPAPEKVQGLAGFTTPLLSWVAKSWHLMLQGW